MVKLKQIVPIVALSWLLIPAESVWADKDRQHSNNATAVEIAQRWIDNMGGREKISSLQTQTISSTLQRWEPEQTFKPGADPIHVATIERSLTNDLNGMRSIAVNQLDSFYPAIVSFDFREIINNSQGYIDGVDGIFSGPQAPMFSTRLGSRQKQYLMTSSLALAQRTLNQLDTLKYKGTRKTSEQKQHVISINAFGHNIDLFIDAKSLLLTRARTIEADTIYGDARWDVVFSDWASVMEIRLPYQVTYVFNGKKIAQDNRHSIALNVPVSDDMFAIPAALQQPLNHDDYRWGIRSSQFFGRTLAFAIPFDLNQGRSELVNIVEIAPKVFHVRAPLHNSLLIEMADYLVLADPVLYEHRSQAVIDKITQQWPDKKIQYVIASHFHADHIGGIRAYAAIGAKIIVGAETKDHYEAIFKAKHTVAADAYQKNPRDVTIIEVDEDETYLLSDGERRIQLLNIENSHATGMLVPYIEDAKMIFTSDLYNPGAFPSPIPPLFSFWAVDLSNALDEINVPIDNIAGAHGGVFSYQQFLDDVELLR